MFRDIGRQRMVGGLVIGVLAVTGIARGESPEDKFHQAFYLDQGVGDKAGAAGLYEEVLATRQADAKLRALAEARLAVCREDMASSDLARLMPPDVFAYVEIQRVGEQVAKLLDKLGLLGDERGRAALADRRLAVSPALIKAVLGLRGVALGINGFDPQRGEPSGVIVIHPGDLEVFRGLIETALPIGGQPTDPIGGYATYFVEDEVYVTLTRRLVVLSRDREQIDGVVRRLKGEDEDSLATSDAMVELAGGRADSLLYFFVNAKPIMPMIQGMMGAQSADRRELALANAILDLDSLRSLTGRVGVADDGIFVDVELRLDEGHHSLAYNLFRMPPIDPKVLESIPQGVAAFVAGSLNEVSSRYAPFSPGDAESPPVVTGFDLGREIFANMAGIAVYALPPEAASADGGPPIPDVAASILVNDPSKSEALWTQILGIASIAAGAMTTEGDTIDIAGVPVRTYRFPDQITLYFATVGRNVLVGSSRSAMTRSIHVQRDGASIRRDAAFAGGMSRIGPDSTKAVLAHPGRCAEIARRFVSRQEWEEIKPFLGVLTDTVVSLVIDHSGERFRIWAGVTGIPQVGDLVTRMIVAEEQKQKRGADLKQAIRDHQWDKALENVDAMLSDRLDDVGLLRRKFEILAAGQKNREAALACAEVMFKKAHDDATALNNFAWALLTEDRFEGQYTEVALEFSERSNELTQHKNWAFLDTLALAKFVTGHAEDAVALEEQAIALAGDNPPKGLLEALVRFKNAIRP